MLLALAAAAGSGAACIAEATAACTKQAIASCAVDKMTTWLTDNPDKATSD